MFPLEASKVFLCNIIVRELLRGTNPKVDILNAKRKQSPDVVNAVLAYDQDKVMANITT